MAPLTPWKARITKTAKTLEDLIETSKPLTSLNIPSLDSEDETIDFLKGKQATINTRITNIEKLLEALKQAQCGLAELFNKLDIQHQRTEETSYEEYTEAAFLSISNAEETLVKLNEKQTEINTRLARSRELEERRRHILAHTAQTPGQQTPTSYTSSLQAQTLLPRLQIPRFTGNKREWDAFWAIFKANIEDQPIPPMMKFNYLLQALSGEARQVANRYQIIEENYPLVVEALKHKYGRDNTIIEELFAQLENTVAAGPSTAQQITLLDRISATMAQLSAKGQDINHRLLLNTVLKKFESNIQLKALEKREQLQNPASWTWQILYNHLSSILDLNERVEQSQKIINNYTNKPDSQKISKENPTKRPQQPCIYCRRTNHISKDCRTVPISERVAFLSRNRMCLNCAKPNHRTSECRSQGCFRCGQKHHSSTPCRGTVTNRQTVPTATRQPPPRPVPLPQSGQTVQTPVWTTPSRQQRQNIYQQSTQNLITSEGNDSETTEQVLERDTQVNQISKHDNSRKDNVVLLTGTATVEGPQGVKSIRVLLDTGSELSFIDSKLVDDMKLPIIGSATLRIKTFGSETSTQKEHRIIKVSLVNKEGISHTYELFDNDVITNSSSPLHLTSKDWDYVRKHGIELSSTPEDQGEPRILIGCDHLWEMVDGKQCKLPSGLHLIKTAFGHMVSGKQSCNLKQAYTPTAQTLTTQMEKDAWDRYWSIESAGTSEYTGPEKTEKQAQNEKVIKTFKETVVKKPDGYYVRLPWKENHADLPENRAMAVARLRNLFRHYPPNELQEIDDIFQQQLQQGVIEQVPPKQNNTSKKIHYLPYQVICRPEKTTTPKRVVFDASAHPRGKPSLNDVLYQGPLIMPTITGMLMRFTVGKIAITADIEKAFLQVHLHENDRDVTRFLWVRDITLPPYEHNIVTFRFTRVTFGLNSSPFLLAATIHFHLDTCPIDPKVTSQIKDNLYVDNLIMTAETTEEALAQYRNTKEIFNSMKMNMRDYVSNDKSLMDTIEDDNKSSNQTVKVLGIEWKTNIDTLVITCAIKPLNKITKRTVLHANASIYDPLGWLTPLMIRNKHFFQSLWKKNYNWDDPLQEEDQKQWRKLCSTITGFYKERPRMLLNKGDTHHLVAFSDASNTAMATCVYIKERHECKLLVAKTKLPSIQGSHTVPKLELNALTLAARLTLSSYRELRKVTATKTVYLFSDSEIVLNWVRNADSSTKSLGVLVNNRIKEIKNIVEEFNNNGITVYFAYVRTSANPSDCATRGLTAEELRNHIWWEGPDFLKNDPEQWPTESRIFELLPHENDILHITIDKPTTFPWHRFSSVKKLERTVVWVLRFIWRASQNLSQETQLRIKNKIATYGEIAQTNITASEMRNAHHAVVLMHQNQFKDVLNSGTQNKLNIKQDHKGIWRCWGRLGKSHLADNAKNPIFVAPNTDLAKLIILQAHGNLHRSTAHTMAEVRSKYWIPRLRQQVRRLIRSCVPCQRFNNFPFRYPAMPDIPERRVVRSRPFQHVGFDLFGPLKTRNTENTNTKTYGSIFTCATTRLIHIELLNDASTTSVINAIRRFIARRGVPSSITCDNAPTFALAEQILEDGRNNSNIEEKLQSFLANSHIRWQRITPYAPWKGGFYERLIKDIKRSLLKTVGRRTISTDSLSTILTEIEGCLNSRPLTYQESDLEDLTPIRPIDFLQNNMTVTYNWDINNINRDQYLPSEELAPLQTKLDAEKALQSSCALVEKFWHSWSEIYLKSLREHHTRLLKQGRTANTTPHIDQVVLLQDPFQNRNNWKLAKIIRLLPSQDDHIRKVELLLPNRHIVIRPTTALVPLELSDNQHQNTEQTSSAPQSSQSSTPTGVSSETTVKSPGDMPATHRLRARVINKNYPYNEDEYEINTISIELMQTRYRMDATAAAVKLIQSLNNNNPPSLLDEKELQRRLDVIYDDITVNISAVHCSQLTLDHVQKQLCEKDPDASVYQTITDLTYQLATSKQKMIADYQMGNILWEIYRLLVEAGGAKKSSKHKYETKPRKEERENSLAVNNDILQKEIQHVDSLLKQISSITINYYVDFPKENVVLDQLTHMRQLLESPRGTLNSVDFVEMKHISITMEKIEQFMKSIDEKLSKIIATQKTDAELLLDAQINSMVQLKRAIQGVQEEPAQSDEEPSTQPMEEEPEEVKLARKRLHELKDVKDRSFGRTRTLLVWDKTLRCCFCSVTGEHDSDHCYKYRTVAERNKIVTDAALCPACLRLCPKPCEVETGCTYCGSSSHHSALCTLPQEKQFCRELVRKWEILGGGSVLERT